MSSLFQEIQKHAQSPITELNRFRSENSSLEGLSTISELTLDRGKKRDPHLLVAVRGGMTVSKQDSTISDVTMDNGITPTSATLPVVRDNTTIPRNGKCRITGLRDDADRMLDPDMIQAQTRTKYAIEENDGGDVGNPVVREPNDRDVISVEDSFITGDETSFDFESVEYSEFTSLAERRVIDLPTMEEVSNKDGISTRSATKSPVILADIRRYCWCIGFGVVLVTAVVVVTVVFVF
jgi:hypothetical protein